MAGAGGPPDLQYVLDGGASVGMPGQRAVPDDIEDVEEWLQWLDEDLAIALQELRPDLYFLHAAALTWGERTILLATPSGGGKSTTCWALLQEGFGYLSDELAPIELSTLRVYPYPRALALKQAPPPPYDLPVGALRLPRLVYVGRPHLRSRLSTEVRGLNAVFFLNRAPERPVGARRLSVSEATARVYAQSLNALAHADEGLQAAIRIASSVPCFELFTGQLPAVAAMVRAALEDR
jgi:hypothetical protein